MFDLQNMNCKNKYILESSTNIYTKTYKKNKFMCFLGPQSPPYRLSV